MQGNNMPQKAKSLLNREVLMRSQEDLMHVDERSEDDLNDHGTEENKQSAVETKTLLEQSPYSRNKQYGNNAYQ